MDFILFGKTILVVNKKFGLFLANQLRKRVQGQCMEGACTCASGGLVSGGLVYTLDFGPLSTGTFFFGGGVLTYYGRPMQGPKIWCLSLVSMER